MDQVSQDRIWEVYQNDEELMSIGCRNTARIIFIAKRLPAGVKVLNIGVGTGRLEEMLVRKGIDVYTLDPSETSIKRIRHLIGLGEEKAKVGYAQAIPFPDASFDFVVMSEVLEHLSDEVLSTALLEVHRVLKEHGYFIGTVPADENLRESLVVCPSCGSRFHRWGHVQSFSAQRLITCLKSVFSFVQVKRRYFCDYSELNWKGKITGTIKYMQAIMNLKGSNQHFYFEARR